MMRGIASFAMLACASRGLAQSAVKIDDFRVDGIHVILKPLTANDVIGVKLYIKGGAAAISPATAGIEKLIVDVAPLGTAKYTKAQFSEKETTTGAEISGEAVVDYTAMSLRAVRQHWDESWELFAQAVAHPTFPATEVDLARAQLINQLKQRADDPDSYLSLLADSISYLGHPFAPEVRGTPESVAKLKSADLARWHARRLTKSNLLIVVVGNVTHADLSAKVRDAFSGLPATGGEAPRVPPLAAAKSSITVVERSLPTNYILGEYVAPIANSRDAVAFRIATRVLNDKLFEEVRTKRNLTYAVSSYFTPGTVGQGYLYVTAVEPDTTLKVMLAEVRKLQREPLPITRLQETVNDYTTGYWMRQETNLGQADEIGYWELQGGGWKNLETIVPRLRQITPADVQRVATRYMKNARFVVVGDPKKIDRKLFTSL